VAGGGFFSINSLHGVWIVVVDGNAVGRQTLVDILSYCGALVTPIASADGALSVMRRVKPDALIVALEDGEGSEFIRRVRSLKPEDGGVVPAIAIGHGDDDDLARSRGFQGYLRVPLDPWELCRLVSNTLTVQ
jgi:CheY-like chemotaxis protein